jgi:hypothetical protein
MIITEPLPGWVDNLNGPVRIMSNCFNLWLSTFFDNVLFLVAASKGVLRTLLCNGEYSGTLNNLMILKIITSRFFSLGECIPVDFAINGLIGIVKSVVSLKEK